MSFENNRGVGLVPYTNWLSLAVHWRGYPLINQYCSTKNPSTLVGGWLTNGWIPPKLLRVDQPIHPIEDQQYQPLSVKSHLGQRLEHTN